MSVLATQQATQQATHPAGYRREERRTAGGRRYYLWHAPDGAVLRSRRQAWAHFAGEMQVEEEAGEEEAEEAVMEEEQFVNTNQQRTDSVRREVDTRCQGMGARCQGMAQDLKELRIAMTQVQKEVAALRLDFTTWCGNKF